MATCHLILVSSVWGYDRRVKWVLPSWPFRKHGQRYVAAPMLTGNGCQERSCLRWQASRLPQRAAFSSVWGFVRSRFCCLGREAWIKISRENLLRWLSTKKKMKAYYSQPGRQNFLLKNEIIYGKAAGSLRGKETSLLRKVSFKLWLFISCGCNDLMQ